MQVFVAKRKAVLILGVSYVVKSMREGNGTSCKTRKHKLPSDRHVYSDLLVLECLKNVALTC